MGRYRSRQPSEPLGGGESCPLCGVRVPVGPDGCCRLGHRVRAAGTAPPDPLPMEAHAATPEPEEVIAEDVVAAPQPEPSVPPPAAVQEASGATPPRELTAPWHPYDEVLVAGPPALGPGSTPVLAPEAPTGGDTRSALEDLLPWDEPMQSALDMSVEELPATTTEPGVDAAPAPAPAETETSVADEETASGSEAAHRRMSVLLGSGALALLALAAFAVAAML